MVTATAIAVMLMVTLHYKHVNARLCAGRVKWTMQPRARISKSRRESSEQAIHALSLDTFDTLDESQRRRTCAQSPRRRRRPSLAVKSIPVDGVARGETRGSSDFHTLISSSLFFFLYDALYMYNPSRQRVIFFFSLSLGKHFRLHLLRVMMGCDDGASFSPGRGQGLHRLLILHICARTMLVCRHPGQVGRLGCRGVR